MAKNTTKSAGFGSDSPQKQAYPKGKSKGPGAKGVPDKDVKKAGKKSPFGGGMAPAFTKK